MMIDVLTGELLVVADVVELSTVRLRRRYHVLSNL